MGMFNSAKGRKPTGIDKVTTNTVFLGGTCNNSTWRKELIPLLTIKYFDPVVDDWTEDCMKEEIRQRKICDYVLYTITPEMMGVYSIAEVVDDSNKRPGRTILCILEEANGKKFDKSEMKSLAQVGRMVEENRARVFYNLKDVAKYLNNGGI